MSKWNWALAVLAAAPLSAQSVGIGASVSSTITATATTAPSGSGPSSTTNMQPIGSDVTTGVVVTASRSGTMVSASARTEMRVVHTPNGPTRISFSQSVSATASVFAYSNATTAGGISVVLTSPTPVPVVLDTAGSGYRSGTTTQSFASTLRIGSNTQLSAPASMPVFQYVTFPHDVTRTTIGPAGLVIRFDGTLAVVGSSRGSGNASATWHVDVYEQPCGFTAYGVSCGPILEGSMTDPALPGKIVLRSVPGSAEIPSYAVLFVGTHQVFWLTPFGCPLQTDWFVALPVALDGLGNSRIAFAPPTTPTDVTMQFANVGTAALFSNGLRILCP